MVQRAVEARPGQSYLVDEVACCSVSHGEKFRPIMRWRCDSRLSRRPLVSTLRGSIPTATHVMCPCSSLALEPTTVPTAGFAETAG